MAVQSPQIGEVLAACRIEALIGQGGMGEVSRALDLRLDRRVALKLLAPRLAGDARLRERVFRESRLAASLDHPNVIPIYEAGEADGRLFMRFVEGTDLRRVLDRERALEPAERSTDQSGMSTTELPGQRRSFTSRWRATGAHPGRAICSSGFGAGHRFG